MSIKNALTSADFLDNFQMIFADRCPSLFYCHSLALLTCPSKTFVPLERSRVTAHFNRVIRDLSASAATPQQKDESSQPILLTSNGRGKKGSDEGHM